VSTAPAPRHTLQGPTLRHVLLITLAACTLVGALLGLIEGPGTLRTMLVFSYAIGFSVLGWSMLLARLPLLSRLPGLVLIVPAAPLGAITGHTLAALVLGFPMFALFTGRGQVTTVVATIVGSGITAYLVAMRVRLSREAAERAQAQQLATEAELRLLRAQIEPHMLFNTLANLRSLVEDDPPAATAMLDQLITYLRGTLDASRSESTTLQHEFDQLRAYLALMQVRLGARLAYTLQLPPALAASRVPPMLLQPLVENAIRHGIEPKLGGGRVEVSAEPRDDGGFEVIVADTGVGLATNDTAGPTATPGAGHYGLQHVRDRLRSLYGGAATFVLQPRPAGEGGGACARVRFPPPAPSPERSTTGLAPCPTTPPAPPPR
jgi:signal transduction histidine kinase